jgi:Ca2+-binding EF-hand superfamily protein
MGFPMTKFILLAATVLAGGAAIAQTAPPTRPMADHVMTRAEALQMVRDHFARVDTNKDGQIAKEEIAAAHGAMAGGPGKRVMRQKGPMRDPNAAFDRLDTNKDGSVSRDEFAKGREVRIEKRVVMRESMKDGAVSPMKMHRMGGIRGGRMIVMADTDKDGRITLAEAEAMALQHFDQMDTNHDGQVTSEERRAGHRLMIQKYRTPTSG